MCGVFVCLCVFMFMCSVFVDTLVSPALVRWNMDFESNIGD